MKQGYFKRWWRTHCNKLPGARVAALSSLLSLVAFQGKGQTYSVLHHFPNSLGSWDGVTLVASGTMLYGTTWNGGSSNQGTLFKVDTSGNGYQEVKSFTGGVDGGGPLGLVLSGATFYGTTFSGGTSNLGTVYKINTDGSGYTGLKSFTGYPTDGANANGGLLLSGETLHGTTEYHGTNVSGGILFRLNTAGGGYTMMHPFGSGDDGAHPVAGLVMSGTTLYGATGGGGRFGYGVLYKVEANGSGYQVLKNFTPTNSDGYWPQAGPIVSEAVLYGTALWSGTGGYGKVFKVNTDGSGYTVLHTFSGSDGKNPIGGLLFCGSVVFGTTWSGGSSDRGTVFQLNTDGSEYTILHNFTGPEGANPHTSLVFSGTNLCGMTTYGGANDGGVLFSLALSPPIITQPPRSQTTEAGASVRFSARATGSAPLTYQWVCNGNPAIGGATTNPAVVLPNVQASSSGAYTVVVSNFLGAVTSSPAMLSVIPPVEQRIVPAIGVTGRAGDSLAVDCADSQLPAGNWWTLGSVDLSNASAFYFDLSTPLPAQRFYRARQVGEPGLAPALGISLVPAVTLTGGVGSRVRLDGINAVGPTDAWFTVATVALTNASQLYFDLSAAGQPNRCYRVVPVP